MDEDFTPSRRPYPDKVRSLTKTLFTRTLANGEIQQRSWLVFSKSKGCVFCAICRLFGQTSQTSSQLVTGYNDWKNASQTFKEHENSSHHRKAAINLLLRAKTCNRVDTKLVSQIENEMKYWRDVLRRVVATVRSLAIRGLPMRGDMERFGTLHSGNFVMSLELLAEFDPFLAQHIRRFGQVGSGNTSYLSTQTCDEFITIMAEEVVRKIILETKEAKYFSISVDSTPDIAHVDQLSFILRYVNTEGTPVERFLAFIPNAGHKSEELANIVLETLIKHDLDVANCRGQSYDNASNMSGRYTGLQARIKEVNPLAVYVPCSAHSLNLVGSCAAECCNQSVTFFGLLQELYNFFTASTHRWKILQSYLHKGSKTIKNLSQTRWSARNDACQSLYNSYDNIKNAIESINGDVTEKPKTRHDASSILKLFESLEMGFMTVFWADVLGKLDSVNKKLQSVDIDLMQVVDLYKSLEGYISNIRDRYDNYEERAKQLCGQKEYKTSNTRKIKRKRQFEESVENEVALDGEEEFKINVFYVIVDRLCSELSRRRSAYEDFFTRFDCFHNLCSLSDEILTNKAKILINCYPSDLEESLINELIHFRIYLSSSDIGVNDTARSVVYPRIPRGPRELLKFINQSDLLDVFPNITIALRMFLCTFATNCSAERSFSALRRIKSYLRSTMNDSRLNSLAILYIESQILRDINYEKIIDAFASKKVRRKPL